MALSKGFELATLGNGLDTDQSTGEVLTINMDTDVVTEGTNNLYFTNERVDDRVNDLVVAGSGILVTYNDTAGTLTFALDNTSGFDLSNNTTDDLAEGLLNLYYTDARVQTYISGGTASFNGTTVTTSGNVIVGGNLTVNGTTTTINSTELAVDDLNITIASGAADAAAADGAGITVDGANATITYNGTNDRWVFNKAPYYNTNRLLTNADNYVENITGSGQITVTHTPAPGSTAAISHGVSGVTAGTYGSATTIPVLTIDAQGHVTVASTASISTDLDIAGDSGTGTILLASETLTIAGDTGITTSVTGNIVSIDLDDTAVTPGSYGSSTTIPVITVDQQGRITSASEQSLQTSFNITDGVTTETVDGGDTITFVDGTDINVSVSATDRITISHNVTGANTSVSPTTNTFVDEITVSAQGHVTNVGTGTISFNVADNYAFKNIVAAGTTIVADSNADTLNISAAQVDSTSGIVIAGNATTDSITIAHADTSTIANVTSSSNNFISAQTYDTYGHVLTTTTGAIDFNVSENYAFKTISDGTNNAVADSNTDTFTITAGSDITAVVNATSDGVTISNTSTLDSVLGRGNSTTKDITVNNAVVNGNLTVNGTTTTLSTNNLVVEDAVIVLNNGQSTPANDAGFVFQRYSSPSAANYNTTFFWDEGSDKFIWASTTETGADNDITPVTSWMTLTSTGRLGIGFDTPTTALDVNGVIRSVGNPVTGDGATLQLFNDNQSTTNYGWQIQQNENASLAITVAGTGGAEISIISDGTDYTNARVLIGNGVQLNSSDISYLNGGNVGIGTTIPQTLLHLAANNNGGASNNTLRFSDTDTGVDANQQIGLIEFYGADISTGSAGLKAYIGAYNEDTTPDAYLAFGTDATTGTASERMRIASTGNVAIGSTDTTTARFRVESPTSGQTLAFFRDQGGTVDLRIVSVVAGTIGVYSGSGEDFILGTTANVENIRIQETTGNIGINNTNPGRKLSIGGDGININNGTNTAVLELYSTTDFRLQATDAFSIFDVTNTATRLNISNTGAIRFNNAYTFPTADGTTGQVLTTNGSGTLTFGNINTAIDWNVADNYAFKTVVAGGTSIVADSNTDTLTISAAQVGSTTGIVITGNATSDGFTIAHADTSTQASSSNTGRTYVQSITLDTYGHVTSIGTATETLEDNYVDSLAFNTTNGILTVGRTGVLADLTVDLDGRYLTAEADTLDTVTGRGATTANDIEVGAVQINATYKLEHASATLATTTATAIATYSASTFGGAKLVVQALDTVTGERQISEMLITHDGTTVKFTEYGVVYTGSAQITALTVVLSGGNVEIRAAGVTTNSTQYKVAETLLLA
jgi:hypothetical protein